MSVPVPWVEVGADAICGHVRSRATTTHIVYCPDCERTAFKVLRAALPLIDAMGASGIRAERQVVTDLRAQVLALPGYPDGTAADEHVVSRDAVLALLGGSDD